MIYKFTKSTEKNYGTDGNGIFFYVNSTSVDFYSEESQLKMLELDDAIERC